MTVTVVASSACAVENSVAFTVPMVSLPLDQSNVMPEILLPAEFLAVATSCCAASMNRFIVSGKTSIEVRTGAALSVEQVTFR